MSRARRWLLSLGAALAVGVAAAALLPACTDCPNPPPDSCVPEEGISREEACLRCGGVTHSCQDGKWIPFPCGANPGGRDR